MGVTWEAATAGSRTTAMTTTSLYLAWHKEKPVPAYGLQRKAYDSSATVSLRASFPNLEFKKWVKKSQNVSFPNDKDSFVKKRTVK